MYVKSHRMDPMDKAIAPCEAQHDVDDIQLLCHSQLHHLHYLSRPRLLPFKV